MEPGRCLLLDWGDTVMRVLPEYQGPMATWPRVEAIEGASEALAGLRGEWTIALATNAADSREEERTDTMFRTVHSLRDLPDALKLLHTMQQ